MLILSEIAKHSNYTQYFIGSPVKENSSFAQWNMHYRKSDMFKKSQILHAKFTLLKHLYNVHIANKNIKISIRTPLRFLD